MLIVRFDPSRPLAEGQFEVALADLDVLTGQTRNRTSYWCDAEHLEAFRRSIDYELDRAGESVLTRAVDNLVENRWYSKDPDYWAAVDRLSLEHLRSVADRMKHKGG